MPHQFGHGDVEHLVRTSRDRGSWKGGRRAGRPPFFDEENQSPVFSRSVKIIVRFLENGPYSPVLPRRIMNVSFR